MQPIYKDDQGTLRFKENKIVRALLDEAQKRAKFGLNQLSMKNFSQADWEQFYQLIGYSITSSVLFQMPLAKRRQKPPRS